MQEPNLHPELQMQQTVASGLAAQTCQFDRPCVKVCPWCGVGLLRLFFLCCGVINKLTLLLVLAAPVKRKGARGEVRFPGDPATMCPVLFKGSRSLLLLACCYVPIGGRMLIFKGGT